MDSDSDEDLKGVEDDPTLGLNNSSSSSSSSSSGSSSSSSSSSSSGGNNNSGGIWSVYPELKLLNVQRASLDSPVYIMHMTHSPLPIPGTHVIAASTSDYSVRLYHFNEANGQITFQNALRGHRGPITSIQFSISSSSSSSSASPQSILFLLTTSEDGTVICWDVRNLQPLAILGLQNKKKVPEYFCASTNGQLVAAGTTKGHIHIWDIRSPTTCRVFREFHTEDVTQMLFHPTKPNILYSGSEDGNICQIDVSVQDEDDALLTVMNTEQPVSKMGFFGPTHNYLYSLSTIETFTLWNPIRATSEAQFTDLRRQLSEKTRQSVDYLVSCHYDPPSQRLFLLAGSNSGVLSVCHVNQRDIQPFAVLTHQQAHTDLVRDCVWFPTSLLTGGQDSKLCVWSSVNPLSPTSSSLSQPFPQSSPSATGSGSASSSPSSSSFSPQSTENKQGARKARFNPYK